MLKEAERQATPEARYRGLLLIWVMQLGSLAIFFAVTRLVAVSPRATGGSDFTRWLYGLLAGMTLTLSFVLKFRLLRRAVAEQRLDYVTTAHVLAYALCEAPALLALVEYLVSGVPNYLLFMLAAVGLLLHFPRRSYLYAASAGGVAQEVKSTLR